MEIKEKYELDNGWDAILDSSQKTFLHVFPIINSIFNKEKIVEVPLEIFIAIKNGDRNIKSLAVNNKIYDYAIQWNKVKNENGLKPENSQKIYYGKGYISEEENEKFYLYYQLARQGGGGRKIPISKTAYLDSRNGEYTLSELFKKHNLFIFDNDKYNLI